MIICKEHRAATGRGRRAESARPGGRSGAARRCRRVPSDLIAGRLFSTDVGLTRSDACSEEAN